LHIIVVPTSVRFKCLFTSLCCEKWKPTLCIFRILQTN